MLKSYFELYDINLPFELTGFGGLFLKPLHYSVLIIVYAFLGRSLVLLLPYYLLSNYTSYFCYTLFNLLALLDLCLDFCYFSFA